MKCSWLQLFMDKRHHAWPMNLDALRLIPFCVLQFFFSSLVYLLSFYVIIYYCWKQGQTFTVFHHVKKVKVSLGHSYARSSSPKVTILRHLIITQFCSTSRGRVYQRVLIVFMDFSLVSVEWPSTVESSRCARTYFKMQLQVHDDSDLFREKRFQMGHVIKLSADISRQIVLLFLFDVDYKNELR